MRIEHAAEDALLTTLIRAAREAAEHLLNISFITQTWQYVVTNAATTCVSLPFGPVIAVTQLHMREREDADWSMVSSDAYHLRGDVLHLVSTASVTLDMRITYTAGFSGDAQDVPAQLCYALLQHVAMLYESRGSAMVVDASPVYASVREVRL